MGTPVRLVALLSAVVLVAGACSDGGSSPAAGTQVGPSASEVSSETSLVPAVSTTSATTVAPATSSATSDPGFLTDSYTPLLPDVVPLLHPGWTYIALRAIDINAYELEIALLAVPTLRARVFYLRNANEVPGTRAVVVSGVNWATAPNIDELTLTRHHHELDARSTASERDKRVRSDGNEQYVEMTGQFAHYLDDPYVEVQERARRCTTRSRWPSSAAASAGCWRRPAARGRHRGPARHREGRRLRRHLVLEPLPGRGVRRRVVHLPAAARGGRLHAEAASTRPRRRSSSTAATIARTSASTTRLLPDRGHRPAWDDRDRRWVISTNRGDRMRARFVVMANGPLHRPKLPGIPGIESFKGTRSTPAGGTTTTPAATRRAGSPAWPTSGSASSAPVPPPCSACRTSAPAAKQLYVFQRTPSSVDVRDNRPTDPEWAQQLEPGWQRAGWTTSTTWSGAFPSRRTWWRRLDRHHRQPAHPHPPGPQRSQPAGPGRDDGAGRLRQDGADPRPRRPIVRTR
jgi:hypothetical protein